MNDIRKGFYERYGDQAVNDGILNPSLYFSDIQRPRIMILLKENHSWNEEKRKVEWNPADSIINTYATYRLCKQPSSVPKYIVKWVNYCLTGEYLDEINAVPEHVKAEFIKEFNQSVLGEYDFVTGFAYLDFKKKDENKKTTEDKDLGAAARNDHDLLYRQIVACAPDAIFCCPKKWSRQPARKTAGH